MYYGGIGTLKCQLRNSGDTGFDTEETWGKVESITMNETKDLHRIDALDYSQNSHQSWSAGAGFKDFTLNIDYFFDPSDSIQAHFANVAKVGKRIKVYFYPNSDGSSDSSATPAITPDKYFADGRISSLSQDNSGDGFIRGSMVVVTEGSMTYTKGTGAIG